MKILAPFEVVKLSETRSGDLVRIAHSLAPMGLVIRQEGYKPVVGVLRDNNNRAPYHIVYERDFQCVRYTGEWVLNLPREQAEFGNMRYSDAAGAIHIGSNGVVLNLAPPDNRENSLTVNLSTFEWDDIASGSVAFPLWQIWATEADIHRSGAVPIVQVAASLERET